jgi:hypothetical protein
MSLPPGGKGFEKAGGERVSCYGDSWKHRQSSTYSNSSAGSRSRSETLAPRALDKRDIGLAGTRKSHIVGHHDRDD